VQLARRIGSNLQRQSVVLSQKEIAMAERSYTGLEFVEWFSVLFIVLWLGGALALGGTAFLGAQKFAAPVSPESNQTPIGNMPTQ
jgi:hypothetical protein